MGEGSTEAVTDVGRSPDVTVHRGPERAVSTGPGLVSRHSFAFGDHAAGGTHHGLLLATNDDALEPGAGYPTHTHTDVEIVSWVLAGALEHRAPDGRVDHVGPGSVQRITAGRGFTHAEYAAGDEPLHVVQMWLLPDEAGLEPGRDARDLSADLAGGGLVAVAAGADRRDADGTVPLAVASAALHVARTPAGGRIELPDAPYLHVLVARGEVDLTGAGPLGPGDAVRLTAAGPRALVATTAAEVLVWEMHEGLEPPTEENPS